MRKQSQFPPGWDEARVRRVLEHYEAQSDEEAVAEDEASFEATTHTLRWMFRLISCPPFASLSPSTSVAPDPPMQTARSPLSRHADLPSHAGPDNSLTRCDDPSLLAQWTASWEDLIEFDIIPVVTSAEAAAAVAGRM